MRPGIVANSYSHFVGKRKKLPAHFQPLSRGKHRKQLRQIRPGSAQIYTAVRESGLLLTGVMFPLRLLVRITRLYAFFVEQLAELADECADPEVRKDPWYCAYFEAAVAFGADRLNLLVGCRVHELLSQRLRKARWRSPPFSTPRPYHEVFARYTRLIARLGQIERLALRRAKKLRRFNLSRIHTQSPRRLHLRDCALTLGPLSSACLALAEVPPPRQSTVLSTSSSSRLRPSPSAACPQCSAPASPPGRTHPPRPR